MSYLRVNFHPFFNELKETSIYLLKGIIKYRYENTYIKSEYYRRIKQDKY